MRAARTFAQGLADDRLIGAVARVRAELFGSLGATGHGHGSDRAVILGLEGEAPETVDTAAGQGRVARARASAGYRLLGEHEVGLAEDDLVLHRRQSLPYHPNGMRFFAYDGAGRLLRERTFYSVGGGFVVDEAAAGADRIKSTTPRCRTRSRPRQACWPSCARFGAFDQRGDAGERDGAAQRSRSAPGCWRSGRSCSSASQTG